MESLSSPSTAIRLADDYSHPAGDAPRHELAVADKDRAQA
jgi:hypothetical protein